MAVKFTCTGELAYRVLFVPTRLLKQTFVEEIFFGARPVKNKDLFWYSWTTDTGVIRWQAVFDYSP